MIGVDVVIDLLRIAEPATRGAVDHGPRGALHAGEQLGVREELDMHLRARQLAGARPADVTYQGAGFDRLVEQHDLTGLGTLSPAVLRHPLDRLVRRALV